MIERRVLYWAEERLPFFFLIFILFLSFSGKVVTEDSASCNATDQTVQLRVTDAAGNTEQYFKDKLCGDTTSTCSGLTVQQLTSAAGSQVGTSTVTSIEMVNFPTALEASLTYASDVRAQFLLASGQTVSQGNPNAGVSASAIYLLSPLFSVPLFMESPPNPYSVVLQLIPTCPANTGYWAFAIIGVLPVALLLFRSPWSSMQYSMPPPQMLGSYQEHPLPPQQPSALENAGFYPSYVPSSAAQSIVPKNVGAPPSALPSHEQEFLRSSQRDPSGEGKKGDVPARVVQYEVLEDGKPYEVEYRKDPTTGGEQIVYIDPETREEYYYE